VDTSHLKGGKDSFKGLIVDIRREPVSSPIRSFITESLHKKEKEETGKRKKHLKWEVDEKTANWVSVGSS